MAHDGKDDLDGTWRYTPPLATNSNTHRYSGGAQSARAASHKFVCRDLIPGDSDKVADDEHQGHRTTRASPTMEVGKAHDTRAVAAETRRLATPSRHLVSPGYGTNYPPVDHPTQPSRGSRLTNWIMWIGSVVACSALFTTFPTVIFGASWGRRAGLDGYSTTTSSINHSNSDVPSPTLRRQNSCVSGGSGFGDSSMPLRVGAIFIILTVSSLACAFPILAARYPKLRMPDNFFFSVRHFGTGVLIATAFVHLLPTAFTLLGDPCLSSFWTEDYPSMPGAISLAGIFFVTVVEMVLHPARNTPHEPETAGKEPVRNSISAKRPLQGRRESVGRGLSGIEGLCTRVNNEKRQDAVPDDTPGDTNSEDASSVAVSDGEPGAGTGRDLETGQQNSTTSIELTPEQKHKKDVMHVLLLEMGILFHSVFIGMTLSLCTGGSEFVILLIAISFHQMFEGLALGARIAAIEWPAKSLQPIFMAIAYGSTTPLGQAIGLAARSAYSPESATGLILVGVMNAFSSGLLIFASLVELLSEDLLADESWRVLRGKRRVYACALIFAGAFGMSLVGAWA